MGRKASTINLSEDERLYLETQMRARTIQAQTVIRARILLLKAEGISVDHIADKVGMNRKSVMLCINKYLEGGVENALFDAPGRGRNAEITDDEKAWIINIACQKPVNLGYSALGSSFSPKIQRLLFAISFKTFPQPSPPLNIWIVDPSIKNVDLPAPWKCTFTSNPFHFADNPNP